MQHQPRSSNSHCNDSHTRRRERSMSAIRPNKDQFVELMEAPDEGPVTMLNLLKFKADADGTGASGAAEYAKYGDAAVQMVGARGGKWLWMGPADQSLTAN